MADLQEVGLVGGHQRAVEGPSPPPCLKVAGDAGFSEIWSGQDKQGRMAVSSMPSGRSAWKVGPRGGPFNIPVSGGSWAGKSLWGLGWDSPYLWRWRGHPGERRTLACWRASYSVWKCQLPREGRCRVHAERPVVPCPPPSLGPLQLTSSSSSVHPAFSPVWIHWASLPLGLPEHLDFWDEHPESWTHVEYHPQPQSCSENYKWSCSVSDSVTPWTIAYQAPPSLGFSGQEYWSGLPFPSPGDLPDPGIEPGSPALWADALPSEPLGKPLC